LPLKVAVLHLKHFRVAALQPDTAPDERRPYAASARDDAPPEFAFKGLVIAALIALPFWGAVALLLYLFR
jgi:hypothetical protein